MTPTGLANFLRMGHNLHNKKTVTDLLIGSDFVLDNEDHPNVIAAAKRLDGVLTNQRFSRVDLSYDKLRLDVAVYSFLVDRLQSVPATNRNTSYRTMCYLCGWVDGYAPPPISAAWYEGTLRSGINTVPMFVAITLFRQLDPGIDTACWDGLENLLGGVDYKYSRNSNITIKDVIVAKSNNLCCNFLNDACKLRTDLNRVLKNGGGR